MKARLTFAIVTLLAVATAVLGAVAVRSTRDSLVENVDDRLMAVGSRFGHGEGFRPSPEVEEVGVLFREFAELMYTADGVLVHSESAGFADDPKPLPMLPPVPSDDLDAMLGEIVTRPSIEGGGRYRVLTYATGDGMVQVVAASLDDVDATGDDVLRAVLLTALLVLVAGGATSWWIIRRGLRPIDRMIGTASAIAAGDLSQRIDQPDRHTELGRLAVALDEMLAKLEVAFSASEESADKLRRFVADASHELRTPVATVRGYAELYRHGGLTDDGAIGRAMGRIEGEGDRMARLVDDLLLLARLDQHQPLDRTRVDVSLLASDAVGDLHAVDPERPITLDAPGGAAVTGDERRLRQVLANLLANARVHTPPGTPVRVEVRSDGDHVELAVADEGPGIAVADRERVLERFYRADPSRSRSSGGTGLGLSIVASVIEAHGGTVEVAASEGGGARIVVQLPSADSVT